MKAGEGTETALTSDFPDLADPPEAPSLFD